MRTTISLVLMFLLVIGFVQSQNTSGAAVEEPSRLWPFRSAVDGKVGFLNQHGEIVAPAQYDEGRDIAARQPYARLASNVLGEPFAEGLRKVQIGGKFGYIDAQGQIAISPIFEIASSFSDGLAAVKLHNLCGYIDHKGAYVIPLRYDKCDSFSEGLAYVERGKQNSFIGHDGKASFEVRVKYDRIDSFSGGLAPVLFSGKYGYIDTNGKEVIHPQFASATPFSEGLAAVCIAKCDGIESSFGYIGSDGHWVIKQTFFAANAFSQGLALVRDSRHFGYIDHTGKFVIAPTFDRAKDFSDGLAVVSNSYGYTYINHNGSSAFDKTFSDAYNFNQGLALVELSRADGRIKLPCESLPRPPIFSSGDPMEPQPSMSSHGAVNRQFHIKCPTLITYIKYGYVDKNGNVVFTGYISFAHEPGLPGPSPPSEYGEPDQVEIEVSTQPSHAKVYLIPLLAWKEMGVHLPVEPARLSQWLQSGYTTYKAKIFQDIYVVVVELNGKQQMRQKDINEFQDRKVMIDFAN